MHPFWILMLEMDMATIPKNQQFRSLFYEKLRCAKKSEGSDNYDRSYPTETIVTIYMSIMTKDPYHNMTPYVCII